MKGQIISSNHTIMIDDFQIDIWYNFKNSWLDIFIDGIIVTSYHFNPSYQTFNYINLLEVAATTLKKFKMIEQANSIKDFKTINESEK